MKLWVLAVGQRMPAWADSAWHDYAKRFPPELRLELREIKAQSRTGTTPETCMQAEASRIEDARPRGCRLVVLYEQGQRLPPQPWPLGFRRGRTTGVTWPL